MVSQLSKQASLCFTSHQKIQRLSHDFSRRLPKFFDVTMPN
jgi:hypothetical protein